MHSKLTEAARSRYQLIEKIEQKKLAFLDKKSIKKEAEWKLWPLEKFSAMYFCENRNLEKKTLSLFSFLYWRPLAFELALLEKLTTLRLITTKPTKQLIVDKFHDY